MSGSAPQPQDGSPRSALTRVVRRNVTVACNECRRKRMRCSGDQPCAACLASGADCVFAVESDRRRSLDRSERRRHSVQSTEQIEGTSEQPKWQARLLDRLRRCKSTEAAQLIALLRSGAALEEMNAFLYARPPTDRNSTWENRTEVESAIEQHKIVHEQSHAPSPMIRSGQSRFIGFLSDDPVYGGVPAKPWTNVTDNSEFVSHLISLWFTFQPAALPLVNRELFIRDMNSQKLDSEFCSRFLVNIMCAEACNYSDFPESNAVPDDKTTSGMHFYEEAQNELQKEQGRTSLPTTQALGCLAGLTRLYGKDHRVWETHMSQEARAAEQWAEKSESHVETLLEEEAENVRKVTKHVVWGVYIHLETCSVSFQLPPLSDLPKKPRPAVNHRNVEWPPYPMVGPRVYFHEDCLFDKYCDAAIIGNELCSLIFPPIESSGVTVNNHDIRNVLEKLDNWHETLPDCVRPGPHSAPHILCLLMHTQNMYVIATSSLRKEEEGASAQSTTGSREPKTTSFHSADDGSWPYLSQGVPSIAHRLCLEHCNKTAKLARMQQRIWGFLRPPICMAQYLTVAILGLLGGLDEVESRASFIDLCVFLRASSRRCVHCQEMLKRVQSEANKLNVALPATSASLFEDYNANSWGELEAEKSSSAYPDLPAQFRHEALFEIELDELLKNAEALEISDG